MCITKNLIVTVWQPFWFFEPLCSILYSQTNGNLCTMTTFLFWRTVHTLTLSWTALQWQLKWPLIKCVINWQNNLSTMGQFFSDWWKSQEWSQKLIHKARWWLIMESSFDCVPLIYTAAVSINCLQIILVHFVTLTFSFKTLFKLCISSLCILFMIALTLWYKVSMNLAQ